MDWNNLINDGTALIASLGLNGVTLGMLTFKTFILDKLGNKNIKKLMGFTAVADKNIKENTTIFTELKNQLLADFKSQIVSFKTDIIKEVVEPLKSQVVSLSKDNEALSNIAVLALSTSNVPLSQKKDMFVILSKVQNISLQAKNILETSIKTQEAQIVVQQTSDNNLEEKINSL